MPYDANDWADWAEPSPAELAELDASPLPESPLAALFDLPALAALDEDEDQDEDQGWDALETVYEERRHLAAELDRQMRILEHALAEVGQTLDELLDNPPLTAGARPVVRLEELRDCLLMALEAELDEQEQESAPTRP